MVSRRDTSWYEEARRLRLQGTPTAEIARRFERTVHHVLVVTRGVLPKPNAKIRP